MLPDLLKGYLPSRVFCALIGLLIGLASGIFSASYVHGANQTSDQLETVTQVVTIERAQVAAQHERAKAFEQKRAAITQLAEVHVEAVRDFSDLRPQLSDPRCDIGADGLQLLAEADRAFGRAAAGAGEPPAAFTESRGAAAATLWPASLLDGITGQALADVRGAVGQTRRVEQSYRKPATDSQEAALVDVVAQ